MDDPDWPDSIDAYTGTFLYFGDNKRPGCELEKTWRGGNKLLKKCFATLHDAPDKRAQIPRFLVFTKRGQGRDVIFRGLAVPGVDGDSADDLAQFGAARTENVSRTTEPSSRSSMRAQFREQWIDAVKEGKALDPSAPSAWQRWADSGVYEPLRAEPVVDYRSRDQQVPTQGRDQALVRCIYEYFKCNPHGFEHCAAKLAGMMDANVNIDIVTRPSRDGGRDANRDLSYRAAGGLDTAGFCPRSKVL